MPILFFNKRTEGALPLYLYLYLRYSNDKVPVIFSARLINDNAPQYMNPRARIEII